MADTPESPKPQEFRRRKTDGEPGQSRFADFATMVDKRLRRLERQLYARWAMTFVFLVLAGILFQLTEHVSSKALHRIQQSRIEATNLNCAILGAISDEGRKVIAIRSPSFARAYVEGISQEVDQRVGHKGDRLVNRDGTINCAVLVRLATGSTAK